MFNMNKYSKTFSIILIITSGLYAQWEYQESGVRVRLTDVCFVDSLNGWSIGDSSTIISTIDGGKSWIKQLNPDTNRSLNKIQFIDQNVGYIIGNDGLILKSNNGGLEWLSINSDYTYNFSDLSFVNKRIGWITGWEETPQTRTGVILHTSDGGIHWEKQIEIISDFLFGSTIFMCIAFLNDSIGWAFGGDYADNFSTTYTYFTNNGGDNWEIIGQCDPGLLIDLDIVNVDTLWAGGFPFVISIDGGKNWKTSEDEEQIIFPVDVSPVNGLKGWAIHSNFISKENILMYTTSGGNNWQEEMNFSNMPANAISNIKGKYLWIVGDSGSIIKKTVNVSSIYSDHKVGNQDFFLYQNYPNPFNPKTVIKYELPFPIKIDLSIYDIIGHKVETLVSTIQKAGIHKIEWDASEFSSGVYFYQLRTKYVSKSGKMLLIK